MGHLLTDLGPSYITDYFSGAYFLHKGKLHKFGCITFDNKLEAFRLEDDYSFKDVMLDPSILESFTKFSWPKMGYRNQSTSTGIVAAAYIQSTRSTRRGLSEECLSINYDTGTQIAQTATYDFIPRTRTMHSVFFPAWVTYVEALELLSTGNALCVALNEDVALAHNVDPSDANARFDILFRGRSVGNVLTDGSITFKNKSITKMSMFKQLLNNRN